MSVMSHGHKNVRKQTHEAHYWQHFFTAHPYLAIKSGFTSSYISLLRHPAEMAWEGTHLGLRNLVVSGVPPSAHFSASRTITSSIFCSILLLGYLGLYRSETMESSLSYFWTETFLDIKQAVCYKQSLAFGKRSVPSLRTPGRTRRAEHKELVIPLRMQSVSRHIFL